LSRVLLLYIFLLTSYTCWAQDNDAQDSSILLQSIVVTGIQNSSPKNTSLHIESYSLQKLETKVPFNLSDALARIPGISQLSTGNAISKPVIRGLFGNRILVLLSGLRFDNQQFQDEHGLGLSMIGIDRVELIRGPASLLYGTEAVGGVINVIEEIPPANQRGKQLDMNVRLYSNTLGTLTDVGLSDRKNASWWRVRGGFESHGDYADGDGTRVYDSRNTGYYFKSGYGFTRKSWESVNTYNFSFNQYGFILDSLNNRHAQDGRWSRAMDEPHHNVLLNIFSSQNTFQLNRNSSENITKGSVLKVNAGVQSNQRAEDEGGGEISLNMHLFSLLQSARWEKYISPKTMIVFNQQATYEKNTNYGKRIIIPDAHMLEGNLSGFVRHSGDKLVLEGGLGITYRQVKTLRTGRLNGPTAINQPFNVGFPAFNAMAGFSYNPSHSINIKSNVATGVRGGNLAELASEGLHEGSFRYEIGNPNLKPEQNITTDLTIEVTKSKWFLSVSGFYNHFNNYIYLTPTADTFQGLFQIYRYVQQDANLYGGEIIGIYKPSKNLQLRESFAATEGITDSKGYLPFIPAWRSQTSVRFERNLSHSLRDFFVEPEFEYVFAQDKPAQFETSSPDYGLVHLYSGCSWYVNDHAFVFGLGIRNLLDKTYADHLSRLRYFGINNQGINVVLSLKTTLGW
jgi:iron complex outermembrane receptor protein